MKYLLLLLFFLLVLWQWRGARSSAAAKTTTVAPPPQPMVACAVCGLHLASTEAFTGRRGAYCSSAHRASAEP